MIRQRQNFHEILHPQLVRHGPKDARPHRFPLLVHDHNRVLIKPNLAPVTALPLHRSADDHAVHDLPLLDLPPRHRVLHRGDDEVAQLPVLATAQNLDARDALGPGVVRDLQTRPHLHEGAALLEARIAARRGDGIGGRRGCECARDSAQQARQVRSGGHGYIERLHSQTLATDPTRGMQLRARLTNAFLAWDPSKCRVRVYEVCIQNRQYAQPGIIYTLTTAHFLESISSSMMSVIVSETGVIYAERIRRDVDCMPSVDDVGFGYGGGFGYDPSGVEGRS